MWTAKIVIVLRHPLHHCNFCGFHYLFGLAQFCIYHISQERERERESVCVCVLSLHLRNYAIADYLQSQGYGETLDSFRRELDTVSGTTRSELGIIIVCLCV